MADRELLSAIGAMLDEKLAPIKQRLEGIETRLENMEIRMDRLESRVGVLEICVNKLTDNVIKLEEHAKNLKSAVEVDVSPRLRTIESCYLDTYKRYQSGIDKMTQMALDIDVLKKTVHDHSVKLLMIS